MPPITESEISIMRDWLQVLCHALTCNQRAGACPLGERCALAKAILRHVVLCDPGTCTDVRCTEYRGLLDHFINCTVSARRASPLPSARTTRGSHGPPAHSRPPQNAACRLCNQVLPSAELGAAAGSREGREEADVGTRPGSKPKRRERAPGARPPRIDRFPPN
jgi:hypothetical protein